MPACVSCGREIAPVPSGELNICPECRAAIQARAPSQNTLPSRRRSVALEHMPVTTVLVGLNVLVFLLMVLSGASFTKPEFQQLVKWGADYGPLTFGAHQYWRTLTSNYVHFGILHIAVNMWCLWNLGMLVERIFDRWTYVLLYTACGIGGSILGLWVHPTAVEAGASGAIFGIADALIAALYLGRLPVPPSALKATLKSLVLFAAYNLFFGLLPGISNAAHVGGLITGLGLGASLAPRLTAPPDERNSWRRWIFIVAAVLLFALFQVVRRAVMPVLAGSNAP